MFMTIHSVYTEILKENIVFTDIWIDTESFKIPGISLMKMEKQHKIRKNMKKYFDAILI